MIYQKSKIIKYSDIKLAKGLCLDNTISTHRANADLGISTTKYGFSWQMLPKGRAIFKTYDGYKMYDDIREIRIANELLCYELSKQLGVLCAEYELATKDNKTGLVTYDVITNPNQKLISAKSLFKAVDVYPKNNFNTYIEALNKYKKLGYKINTKKVVYALYKMSLFDALTMQTDRHTENVFFIVDGKKKTITLAPLLDNELAFASGVCYEILNSDSYIYPESIKNYTYMINKFVQVKSSAVGLDVFRENIKNLANLAKKDSHFNKIFNEFLANYNIKNAVNILKQKGVEINDKYEQFLCDTQSIITKMLYDSYNTNQSKNNAKERSF